MERRWQVRIVMVTVLALVAGLAGEAGAQRMPRTASIATNPPGTVFYALAAGLAKVATDATGLQLTVQPYTGTSTFMPLLNNGELDFGVNNAVDMALAYRGAQKLQVGGRNPFPHTPNARLVMRGTRFIVGLVVRKDSPLKTVHDARGKRVTGEYPAHLAVWYNLFGFLTGAGMTWSDVKVVPVPAAPEGVDALVQGRAEVTLFSLNAAKIREADAAVGIRFLPGDCSRDGEKRVREAVPGYQPVIVKAGTAVGIVEDTCAISYDLYFTTHKALPDQVVSTVLKGIWDNVEKLPALHPTFKEWTRDRAASAEVTVPYHPAAIKFYREQGVWKPEMDQAQQKLLAVNQ